MISKQSVESTKRNLASSLSRRLFDAEGSVRTLSPVRPIHSTSKQNSNAICTVDAQKKRVKNNINLGSNVDECVNTRVNKSDGYVGSDCETSCPVKANSYDSVDVSEKLALRVVQLEQENKDLTQENMRLRLCISKITSQYNALHTSLQQAKSSVQHLSAQNSALAQKLTFSDQKLDQYISTAFVQRTTIKDLEAANESLTRKHAAALNALNIAALTSSTKINFDAQFSCAKRKSDFLATEIAPKQFNDVKFKNVKWSESERLARVNASCDLFREPQVNSRGKKPHALNRKSACSFLFEETDEKIFPHLCGF